MDDLRFECSTCGDWHVGLPDLAIDEPLPWAEVPREDRAGRGEITTEWSLLDEDQCFVRGVLELPIAARDDVFGHGVWVSLSPTNFARFRELEGSDRGQGDGPWFGWLSVRIPGYPDTFLLKTRVHLRPPPMRPAIELEPTDHPLAMEQRLGVRLARVLELVEQALHPDGAAEGLTDFVHVKCDSHGEGHGCFVCRHIARGGEEGWFSADHAGDPWPGAWCRACEANREAAGGWTEDLEAAAGIELICHRCYDEKRRDRTE